MAETSRSVRHRRSPSPPLVAFRRIVAPRKYIKSEPMILSNDDPIILPDEDSDVVILPTPEKPRPPEITLESQVATQVPQSNAPSQVLSSFQATRETWNFAPMCQDLTRDDAGSNLPSTSRSKTSQRAQSAKTSKSQRPVFMPSLNTGYHEAEKLPTSDEDNCDDDESQPAVVPRQSPPLSQSPEAFEFEPWSSRSPSPAENANKSASDEDLPQAQTTVPRANDRGFSPSKNMEQSDSDDDLPQAQTTIPRANNRSSPPSKNVEQSDSDEDLPQPRKNPFHRPKLATPDDESDSGDEAERQKYTGEDGDFRWIFKTATVEEAAEAAEKNRRRMQRDYSELKGKTFAQFELRGMLWWLMKNHYLHTNKSNARWQEMIDDGYLIHRTKVSLLNHYAKSIVPDLASGKWRAPAVIKKKLTKKKSKL